MNSVLFLLIGVQLVTIPFDLGVSGLAFVFEAGSSWIGFRSFQKAKGERSWWQAIRQSKDPVGFTILLENAAALVGIAIAALGTWGAVAL